MTREKRGHGAPESVAAHGKCAICSTVADGRRFLPRPGSEAPPGMQAVLRLRWAESGPPERHTLPVFLCSPCLLGAHTSVVTHEEE